MAVMASAISGVVTSASRTLEAIRPKVHESGPADDSLHRVREDARHEAEDEQHAEDPQSVAGYRLPALGEGGADPVALDHDQRDRQHEPWPDSHADEHEKDPRAVSVAASSQPGANRRLSSNAAALTRLTWGQNRSSRARNDGSAPSSSCRSSIVWTRSAVIQNEATTESTTAA